MRNSANNVCIDRVSHKPLIRTILTWDFYNDIRDDFENPEVQAYNLVKRSMSYAGKALQKDTAGLYDVLTTICPERLKRLSVTYESFEEYICQTFPLYVIEILSTIERAKSLALLNRHTVTFEGSPKYWRTNKDACLNSRLFCICFRTQSKEDKPMCYREDLVLVTFSDSEPQSQGITNQQDDAAKVATRFAERHIIGIVKSFQNPFVIIELFIPDITPEDNPELFTRLNNLAAALEHPAAYTWKIATIMNMVTCLREYEALMSLPQVLMGDTILNSNLSRSEILENGIAYVEELKKQVTDEQKQPPNKVILALLTSIQDNNTQKLAALKTKSASDNYVKTLEAAPKLKATLQKFHNASQLAALMDCLKVSGVTLIQGPPGTGKTTTVIGAISVILSSEAKRKALHKPSSSESLSGSTRVSSSDLKQLSAELSDNSFKEAMEKAQPWVHDSHYTSWSDKVSTMEHDIQTSYKIMEKELIAAKIYFDEAAYEDQPRRLLICAPSNAAIDEIVKRLAEDPEKGGGIFDREGQRYTPSILRLGPNFHPDLHVHSLEYKLEKRMKSYAKIMPAWQRRLVIRSIVEEATIVCATLSMGGARYLFNLSKSFDTVIIDEASQAVELSTLIPLKLGCRRLILVGDPKQLPATIFSRVALLYRYDQSMFERFEQAGHKINLLSVQYRMHPLIAAFPSSRFYKGNLLNAPNIHQLTLPPIPYYDIPIFSPVVYFQAESQEEQGIVNSLMNVAEVKFICQLIDLVRSLYNEIPGYCEHWQSKVAIISPYAEQVKLIKFMLANLFQVHHGDALPIDVRTVDEFQGQEKDVIIFSAVRAQLIDDDPKILRTIGFLADRRRMNVALTRARLNLWVVGHSIHLNCNRDWAAFHSYTTDKACQIRLSDDFGNNPGALRGLLQEYLDRTPTAQTLLEQHVPVFARNLSQCPDLRSLFNNFDTVFEKYLARREAQETMGDEEEIFFQRVAAPIMAIEY